MKNGLLELKTDTWAVIGTGAVFATIMVTIMFALHAATNARITEQGERLEARITEQGERLEARITEQGERLEVRITEQGERLDARISEQFERLDERISEQNARLGARIDAQGARIDTLYDTMRNEHALILESIAGVAQRVSYIEGHLGIGRAADPEAAGPP